MSRHIRCFCFVATLSLAFFAFFISGTSAAGNSVVTIDAQNLVPRATLFISPSSQTILEGSTFNVSIYLDTHGNSANTIDALLQFPTNRLSIVNPSGGKSLIQVWLQPPSYSNVDGTARYTGIIPNGIVTSGGLIATIAFKAIAPGTADIKVSPASSVLANDGLGTQMRAEFGRASFVVKPTPPGGVNVYSPTHPFESRWYNNASPIFQWDKDPDVIGLSYILDNNPSTIPPDIVNTTGTTVSYQNLGDGLWYFHIKALKGTAWGIPTTFLTQIDTQPPAVFTPQVETLTGGEGNKVLVSFIDTDPLSGIDHYEVAVLDKNAPPITSPVFVQADSPYQLSVGTGNYHVIVRAVDQAANRRDEAVDISISAPFFELLKQNELPLVVAFLILIILLFILHYFFGHKVWRRAKLALYAIENEERMEKIEEAAHIIEEEKQGHGQS